MPAKAPTPDRMIMFSDAVFAVIITILVLEMKPPHDASLAGLLSLWPTAVSYAVSYLFIAIVWINHHHVLRHADTATPSLLWGNFAHLFSVSLMPFSTAWIADTELAAIPVSFYAGVFFLVNATYILLCREAVDRDPNTDVPHHARKMMRIRSLTTLGVFLVAALIALKYPIAGLIVICLNLLLYLSPEAPGRANRAA
jgi:uncharacterized membrane protein